MLTDEKKKRIEALTTEEMLYEINLGHRSHFQREKFAYLKTCYELRKSKNESATEIKNIGTNPPADIANDENNQLVKGVWNLNKFAFWVTVAVFALIVIWVLNHYLNLGL